MLEQTSLNGWMLSWAGFHARTSAPQAREQDLAAHEAGYGRNTHGSLAYFDPDTQSWKTSQTSFLWGWANFSATFPPSGMTRSGKLFRRVRSVRHIHAPGCFLWPTPQAQDAKHGAPTAWERLHPVQPHLHMIVGDRVHPELAEWLMGFPDGWTDLEGSATP